MSEDIKFSALFILIGIVGLLLGLTGKSPSYGGGWVRKYASIIVGIISLLYGIFSLL